MTPQTTNGRESRDLVLAVSGSRLDLGSIFLRLVIHGSIFIARKLSELTFEPNNYVSLFVSSFVNTISLIK